MSAFPLVIFLTLASHSDRASTIPPGCRADYDSCHEDCTVEYGGVTTKYRQLTQCVDKCLSEQDDCTTRHYSLRDAQMEEPSSRGRDKRSTGGDEFGDPRPAESTPRDGTRRGVYRATDEEAPAPAKAEPPVTREPAPPRAPEPEPEPEPKPAPPPRPAARSTPPPAPAATKPAPKAASGDEDIPVFGSSSEDEEAPAPKPKPAPAPSGPLHPTPPPEPKKKDISDWDPNAK
jgi:hypothetical protein